MSAEFKTSFEKLGGTIADQIWMEEGQKDLTRIVDHMPTDFDLVFYGGTFEGAPLLRSLRAAGTTDLFATGDGCWDVENFLEPAGSAVHAGEGILVLSATPELGRVPASLAFAERYSNRYGRIGNYAVNSYDATKLLLTAIRNAATANGEVPAREAVTLALRDSSSQGIAYPSPVRWSAEGDNTSAVTALYTADSAKFSQVAQIPRSDAE